MPHHRIRVNRTSAAPPSAVYALLADIDTWSHWGAWEAAELESPAPDGTGGVGAIRRLTSRVFGRVIVSRELVVEAVPDRRIVYQLLSGLPLDGYRGVVELEPSASGGTDITWSSSFDARIWGTGWLFQLMLRLFIASTAAAVGKAAAEPLARPA